MEKELIIKLDLSLIEVNKILEVLQNRPYKEVSELIFKIKKMGDEQFDKMNK